MGHSSSKFRSEVTLNFNGCAFIFHMYDLRAVFIRESSDFEDVQRIFQKLMDENTWFYDILKDVPNKWGFELKDRVFEPDFDNTDVKAKGFDL